MVNNGSLHYDHDRDGTHTQIAGCSSKFRNLEHDTILLVRYQHKKGLLTGISKVFKKHRKWLMIFY